MQMIKLEKVAAEVRRCARLVRLGCRPASLATHAFSGYFRF